MKDLVTIYLPLASLGIFLGGWIRAWVKSLPEIPYCLSDFYYIFSRRWMFTAWLGIFSTLLFPALLRLSTFPWPLPLGLYVGCLLVSLAPDFKNSKRQYRVHLTGAVLSMVCSQILLSSHPVSYLGWLVFIHWALLSFIHQRLHSKGICRGFEGELKEELLEKEDWLWWMELSMFIQIYLWVFIPYL